MIAGPRRVDYELLHVGCVNLIGGLQIAEPDWQGVLY
jgi:hypothetical protein